jgi:hypothetical protein
MNTNYKLKNQNVMKTKKFVVSMKAVLAAVMFLSFSFALNAQFQTPDPNSPVTQGPIEEVRTGATITYDVDDNHTAGERYRWEVTGGTITTATGGTISGGGTIVEFADDVHTIVVEWDQAPATATGSVSAQVQVQKQNSFGCYSQIQTLPVTVWNEATAVITTASESICSGAGPTITDVPVALTGAPDGTVQGFAVDYSFTIPVNLTALDGLGNPVATTGTVNTDGSSVDIPLPATLINDTGGDLDFVVSLTRMNDDFTGDGDISGSGTYTITVHPVPETGDIQSDPAPLTRRL